MWKRIPTDLKSGNAELGQIWMVGQRMWQRDWPAVHVALNAEWSEDVSDIMAALKGIYSKLRVSILNYSKYFFVYLSESYLFFQKKFLKILYFNFFKKKTIPMKSYKKKKGIISMLASIIACFFR